MSQPGFLHAIHDAHPPELHGDKPGWVVLTEAIGADPNDTRGGDYRQWTQRGITPIVRLNHGYGATGTLPKPDRYADFAQRVANYMQHSRGCTRYIIGNEPNISQERPDKLPIWSRDYAACFRLCAEAVRQRGGSIADLIVAPVAPWNAETGDWLRYWQDVLERVGGMAGGLALHTYSHGSDPALITSDAKMDAPFDDRFYHFRAYRDLLAAVPAELRHLPVYITEANQDDPWLDQNNGWVQAAFSEVDAWNQQPGTQKIHCLALYRWPKYDQWSIEDKPQVQAMFREVVEKGYRVPEFVNEKSPKPIHNPDSVSQDIHKTYLPHVAGGAPRPVQPREWDERLTRRKVELIEHQPQPGETYWRLVKAEYLEEKEHIFVNTIDEQGNPLPGITVICENGGEVGRATEDKSNDPFALGMVNFPMYAAGWAYSVRVAGGQSDTVRGMGLGTYDEPEVGHHISYRLTFQRVAVKISAPQQPAKPQPQPEQPKPQPQPVPPLVHPVADPAYRTITQRFGERPDYYRQFAVDGVALRGHSGIDYAAPIGSLVVAVDSGRVVEVADEGNSGYGKYIKLAHRWGESLYAHLSEQHAQVGETVGRGEVIGVSGNTGNSTGAHLHFALRVKPFNRADGWGGFTDPLPYLQQDHAMPGDDNRPIVEIIRAAAREFGVDTNLLLSQMMAESSFDPSAVSSAGAKGLGQIMDATWAEWSAKVGASDIFDARDNARVAAAYLAWLIKQTGHEWKALVAYGFGIGNLTSGKPIPIVWRQYADRILFGKWLLDAVRG